MGLHSIQKEMKRLVRERGALKAENERLKAAIDTPLGNDVHTSPQDCPTWWGGCHCTVETLEHNIKRVEFVADQNDKLRAELTALQARLAGARKVSVCRGGGSTVPESSVFIDNCCIDSPIEAFCKCGVDLQPGREQTVFVLPAEEGEVTT